MWLDLKLIDPGDPLTEVEEGRADLAIIVYPRPSDPGHGIELVPLLDDPYRAVLPRAHRLARKRVLDLADLSDEPWVCVDPIPGACRAILDGACASAGFSPNVVVKSEDYPSAQGFIAAGLGVGLVPELGLGAPHPGVVVRRVRNPQPSRHIHAVMAARMAASPAVHTFLEAMQEATANVA